jgi:hypothetical protein
MGTTFKNLADAAAGFDALSVRIDNLTRDLQFHTIRAELQPRLDQILAAHSGVAVPASDPATGTIDPCALDSALAPLGDMHPGSMPPWRRDEVKTLLRSMGRLL